MCTIFLLFSSSCFFLLQPRETGVRVHGLLERLLLRRVPDDHDERRRICGRRLLRTHLQRYLRLRCLSQVPRVSVRRDGTRRADCPVAVDAVTSSLSLTHPLIHLPTPTPRHPSTHRATQDTQDHQRVPRLSSSRNRLQKKSRISPLTLTLCQHLRQEGPIPCIFF